MKINYSKEIKAIKNQSVVNVIHQQLQDLILKEKILPGERINEYRISENLQVSRTSIREACRQLEKEGLVNIKKNQGVFVNSIDVEEAKELIQIRIVLEALAVELACAQANSKTVRKLENVFLNMKKYIQSDDESSFYEAGLEFHHIIIRSSNNKSLISMIETITNKQKLFRKKFFLTHKGIAFSIKQYEDIFNLIKQQKGKEAAEIMKIHIAPTMETKL